MEIKSTLWQKIAIVPIGLLICGTAVASCLSPFVPALHTTSRTGQVNPLSTLDTIAAIVMGLLMFAFGFSLWWTVMKYTIRADADGISQTNGFFSQSVRWADVASYYMQPNRRYYQQRAMHVEPVMFDAEGKVIFRGFAHLFKSTEKIVEQRREFWQFVEAQLEGKRTEAPSRERDLEVLAAKSLEVNWSEKSVAWKIGRAMAVVCYALFWLGITMAPIFYIVSNDITIPKPWGTLLVTPMFVGPFLPHIIWLKLKKRKIEREMKTRDGAE